MYKQILVFLLACLACAASADSPLPPPTRIVACSHSGEFCAVSDPVTRKTSVTRRDMSTSLWTIAGWHRWLIVTEDGQRVVVGYGGLNLVEKDAELDTKVLFFYGPSGLMKSVSLADLYRSKAEMNETVSHYEWEQSVELDANGHLMVQKVDGSKVMFDPQSGSRL